MKNVFYKFFSVCIVVTCICVLFYSCNKNKQNIEETDESELLLNELDSFNAELLKQRHIDRQYDVRSNTFSAPLTRSPGTGVVVAVADIKFGWKGFKWGSKAGALAGPHSAVIVGSLGALAAGTIASLAAYEGTKGGSMEITNSLTPEQMLLMRDAYLAEEVALPCLEVDRSDVQMNISMPQRYASSLSIGEMHNAIVEMAVNPTINIPALTNHLESDELEYIQRDDFLTLFNEAKNCDVTIQDGVDGLDSRLIEQIANLFTEAYYACSSSIPTVDYIINNYLMTLEDYNVLSDEDKQIIYTGLSIAAYSTRYWSRLQ